MTTQLIKLQSKFILVSDEEITKHTKPCYCYNSIKNTWNDDVVLYQGVMPMYHYRGFKKIIAGIQEMPTINFSHLSEEDCKRIGWVDVDGLAEHSSEMQEGTYTVQHKTTYKHGFEDGFQKCQSLNENTFSLEDMDKCFRAGQKWADKIKYYEEAPMFFSIFIQSLQQKIWDVEVEMEEYGFLEEWSEEGGAFQTSKQRPKITNNSIKVTKIL